MSIERRVARGALGGIVATAAMSALMVSGRSMGLLGRLPPHEITSKSVARAGLADDVPPQDRRMLGWLGHFGFGAIAGAGFALLRSVLRPPGPVPVQGLAFGSAVWFVSYQGWIPALHLLPAASDDHLGRPATMLAAHLVFGTVLGAVTAGGAARGRPG